MKTPQTAEEFAQRVLFTLDRIHAREADAPHEVFMELRQLCAQVIKPKPVPECGYVIEDGKRRWECTPECKTIPPHLTAHDVRRLMAEGACLSDELSIRTRRMSRKPETAR